LQHEPGGRQPLTSRMDGLRTAQLQVTLSHGFLNVMQARHRAALRRETQPGTNRAAELRVLLPGCQCRRPARPVKGAKILCPLTRDRRTLRAAPCLPRVPERSKHLRAPAARGRPLTGQSVRSFRRLRVKATASRGPGPGAAEGARAMNETTITMGATWWLIPSCGSPHRARRWRTSGSPRRSGSRERAAGRTATPCSWP
jgi:hypothetical protein